MNNLIIVGTSHIAKESVRKVKRTIEEFKPDLVAVELDHRRLHALFQKEQKGPSIYAIGKVGLKGFLFALIGSWASKRLGRMVGVSPGEEMKTAVRTARKHKIQIALIDQDIEITLARFSRYLTWKERWQIIKDILSGLVFPKREMKKYGLDQFDLKKVPSEELVKKMIAMVKDHYPMIYKVLIHERNVVMANKLKSMITQDPDKKIVAVVGAGHVEGMMEILQEPAFSYGYSFEAGPDEEFMI